jgi:hypothetical protein
MLKNTMPAPDVIVDFVFEDGLFFLTVSNIGPEPAERVHISFDPSFKGLGGSLSIPDLPLFRNIEFLAPSRSIRTLLDSSAAWFARQEPERVTINVSFADRAGRNYKSAIRHDLSIYRDLTFVPQNKELS